MSTKLGVCKQWTGLLEWITGLTFDLKFSYIAVRREKRVRTTLFFAGTV